MNGVTKTAKMTKPPLMRPAALRERRRGSRLPTMTAGRVGGVGVQVVDVSLSGVGFRSSERFEKGSVHEVVIGNGPMFLEARVCVMRVKARRDGTFDVGAVFV